MCIIVPGQTLFDFFYVNKFVLAFDVYFFISLFTIDNDFKFYLEFDYVEKLHQLYCLWFGDVRTRKGDIHFFVVVG